MFKRFLLSGLITALFHSFGFAQVEDTMYQNIEEVLISAQREKKIVFEDPKYYIVDFTVAYDHAILLMRNFGTYYLYELDEEMNFRHKVKLDINANFLFDDCFGNVHVVTKDSVYFVLNDSLGLFLTETHPRRQFMNAMMRCAGSTSEKIVFEKKGNYNQDQTFYTVDIESGDRTVVYEMKDSELTRSMREAAAQLYLLDYRENQRIDGDSPGGGPPLETTRKQDADAQRIKNGSYDRLKFVASHVLRPKYNPLFTVDDTLYVFNHVDGKAEVLDDQGTIVNSIPIDYHLRKNWDKKVYADKIEKEFYAVRLRKGVQQLIRLPFEKDGQSSSSEITKHAYPKKVMVRDGFAFYTYKPTFDSNLNKLYRQKL